MDLDGGAPDVPVPPGPAAEAPASYLARCLIADRGFVAGSLPEAQPLAAACDVILTAADGLSLTIACIVDRDAAPERTFARSAAQVEAVATACLVHSGSLYGSRIPVAVEIWEVGAGRPGPGDRERLEALTFRRGGKAAVSITAFAVDSATGALFGTIVAAELRRRQKWVTGIFTGPRRGPDAPGAERGAVIASRRPVATVALLATLLAVFVLEVLLSPSTTGALSPPLSVLIGLGGLEHHRVEAGEVWRAMTAAFLHGDLLHLLFNGVALFMAGSVLERLVGRAWMLGLFVIGALGGSAASMLVNPANLTTVGASGAIMGMLAAAVIVVLRLPRGQGRTAILVSLAQILVPSLLPVATAAGGGRVDVAAHIGGALVGAVAGGLLLVTWPGRSVDPRGRWLARGLVAAGAIPLVIGAVGVASGWSEVRAGFAVDRQLAPIETIQANLANDVPRERLVTLVGRYPRDPRVRYLAALGGLRAQALDEARAHLEAGLAEPAALRRLENPALAIEMHEWLAAIHADQGRADEARETVKPACGSPVPTVLPKGVRDELCALP